MQLDSKLFGSRVARRIFFSFVLASLIPIVLTAVLAFKQVGDTLRERAREELQQASRNAGQLLLDRLILAKNMLEALPERTGVQPPAALAAGQLIDSSGVRRKLFGEIGDAQIPQLAPGGKPALIVRAGAADEDVLIAVQRDQRVIVGRVDSSYLWGTAGLLPYGLDLCVFQRDLHAPLFCSRSLPAEALVALSASMARQTAGNVVWTSEGAETMSTHWELFIPSRFDGQPWTIVISQPTELALQSLQGFNSAFRAALVISLILILLLSATQIRRVLGPIERLVAGTKRIAMQQFSARVDLGRDDEFGQLGDAMNTMAAQLGRQFDMLTALAEIDRLILSSTDIEQVLDAVIERVKAIAPGCDIRVLLIDPDQENRARLYHHSAGRGTFHESARVEVPEPLRTWFNEHPQGAMIDVALAAELDTESAVLTDVGPASIVPVMQAEHLRGALIAQRRSGESVDATESDSLRELSSRLAVAITAAERERELFERAHFDALTGLPNRQLCYDRLHQALAHARREGHQLAVLFIDLDGFKNINDSGGHASGDAVLCEVAARLTAALRDGDTVARLGGDEYVVILPHVGDALDVESIATQVADALRRPFLVDGRDVSITASIGITVFPDDATTVEELLRKADTAMYDAKDAGRARCVFFAEEMDQRVKERLALQVDLGAALNRGEFFLAYQPQIAMASGQIIGVEALLRWRHPTRGLLGPAVFVPVLEEIGLIEAVGQWVLRTAIREFIGWRRIGLPIGRIAVNVASRQLQNAGFAGLVEQLLDEFALEGGALELELTESSFVADFSRANGSLSRLRAAGVRIAIDDFGTGYSSLGYLKELVFDTLKIDKAFVDELPDAKSIAIVSAVLAVAHSLGKEVIAEGVETEQQLEMLSRLGCDMAQGFLFGQPCEASELPACAAALAGGGEDTADDSSSREDAAVADAADG